MAGHPGTVLSTDPVALLVDADGDLDISGGRARFAAGLTAVAQGINCRLNTPRGTLAWDRSRGFPLFPNDYVSESDAILGDQYDRARAQSDFTTMILDTPNAAEVTSFALNYNAATRKASPTYRVRCAFDDITSELVA